MTLKPQLTVIISQIINQTLHKHKGNQTKAAIELDISRGMLRAYMDPKYKARAKTKPTVLQRSFEL